MAFSYALGLSRFGHQVEVFCPEFYRLTREMETPFQIHRLKPLVKFRNSAFLPQLLTRLSDFDIVNLHYPFYGGAELVFLLKKIKRSRLKLVINYHMDNIGKGVMGLAFKLNTTYLIPQILRSGDKIIVTSYDYAAHSSAAKVFAKDRERFVAIPPGVDVEKLKPGRKDHKLLKKYSIKSEDRVVLFVGGLDEAHSFKGLNFLIEAWQDLGMDRTKLLIIGQGDLREEYKNLTARLGLSESVLFADPVDDRQLPNYYNLSDLLVLPSINSAEAFGIVLIEAMACGVPVIASDLPGVRGVVENERNGFLFRVKNRSDLLARIRYFLTNCGQLHSFKEQARKMAVSKYSENEVWTRLDAVFREVCRK